MTTGQKVLVSIGLAIAALLAFGLRARSEARDRATYNCGQGLTDRYVKEGYTFSYHTPSNVTYESPLYQITWSDLSALYESSEGKRAFKTDAMCIFD